VTSPRMRVLIDNDFSGDPDGLFQLAHHVLSPSVDIRAIIGSHLRPGDPFDPSEQTATNACGRVVDVLTALGMPEEFRVIEGSNTGLLDETTPIRSAAALAIVEEAMRDDSELPLFVACGAGLTELASAWLIEPRIADRLTLVWIGGVEDPALAVAPPGGSDIEYNLNIDPIAASVIFTDSPIRIWQVPRNAYRQTLMSTAELDARVRPAGEIGELLADSISSVVTMAGAFGLPLGETYIYGDSPLVLLTALQSSFEADPSSSEYAIRPAPKISIDGTTTFDGAGRDIRVYTRLDLRLLFEDLFAKLAPFGGQRRKGG
jgi:purine nucleosidase